MQTTTHRSEPFTAPCAANTYGNSGDMRYEVKVTVNETDHKIFIIYRATFTDHFDPSTPGKVIEYYWFDEEYSKQQNSGLNITGIKIKMPEGSAFTSPKRVAEITVSA